MKLIIGLLRPQQWYKNLVVFLALIFSWNLAKTELILLSIIGFIALSLLSSANYIINDIIDRKKDRLHPTKRMRPIAKGDISIKISLFISIILFITSLLIALSINLFFAEIILFMFLFTLVYSLLLKKIPILDILGIGINFIARAVAGAIIISVYISPWLILCPFFLSLFLSASKRKGDLEISKSIYNKKTILIIIFISEILLMISYILYIIEVNLSLILTLPLCIYVVFRYNYFIKNKNEIIRDPNFALKDTKLMIGIIGWIILTIMILYL